MAPPGRPPLGFVWDVRRGFVDKATNESFHPDIHREAIKGRKRESERKRYWGPENNVRQRRLARYAKTYKLQAPRANLDKWIARSEGKD